MDLGLELLSVVEGMVDMLKYVTEMHSLTDWLQTTGKITDENALKWFKIQYFEIQKKQ